MAKRKIKRKTTKSDTPSLPDPVEVGARFECDGRSFEIIEVEGHNQLERSYLVSPADVDADADGHSSGPEPPVYWLAHRRSGGEWPDFETLVEGLARVHDGRHYRLLPRVVAHERTELGELLVLDRFIGPTLADCWDRLAAPEVRTLTFEQVLLTLSKLHRVGLIVGNLSRQSFVANDRNDLQLVGLSTLTRRGDRLAHVEQTAYTSPELDQDPVVDERTDIFSVGALFAEAFLGRAFESDQDLVELLQDEAVVQPVVSQVLAGSLVGRDVRFLSVDEMRILLYQLKNEQARFPRPTVAISSTVGVSRFRYINEDSAGFQELGVQYQSRPQHVGFYCVADGMGGHELGERASQLAVLGALQAFRQITQEISFERLQENGPAYALSLGRAASQIVCSGAEQFPGGARMGTTFTGVLVLNDELALTHVGDSRALLLRDGELSSLSLDHSLVASLVRVGQMTEEEAAVSDERNVLVRCIDARLPMDESGFDSLHAVGMADGRLRIAPGDVVLLVSDGVWGVLPDEQMIEAASKGRIPQEIADGVVNAAITAGSDDNATALVISWA